MATQKKRRPYRRRSTEEQIRDLEAQIAVLKRQAAEEKKFTPDAVFRDRERLELSRADYAQLVGVSALTIYHWEHGHSKPRVAQLERWLAVKNRKAQDAWRELGYA